MDIAYNGSNQVASVTDTANPYRAFAHDDRGNVTDDGRYTFVYDHADQPTSVSDTGGTLAAYTYDGNKKRVKQVVNGKTFYFVYSAVTGGLIFKDDVTDTKATDYASIGPASVRIENGSTPVYTHADHLGSPVASTDSSGTLLWRESYLPFGEKLLSPAGNADNTGYTGHVEDAVTGLTYMQARYFDPLIGRFYSTDPIDYQDQLNLYAYVGNDPVNLVDPNGQESMAAMDRRNAGALAAARNPQAGIRVMGVAAATAVPFYAAMAAPAASTFVLSRAPQLNSAGIVAAEVAAGDALGGASLSIAGVAFAKGLDNALGSIARGGDNLMSVSLSTSHGNVGVLAEISTDGRTLLLNDLTVFAEEGGDIAAGSIVKEMLGAKSSLAEAAASRGFTEVKVNATRTELSSSANPGTRSMTFSACRATRIEDAKGC